MDVMLDDRSESRFSVYVERIVKGIGHADRAGSLRDWYLGLLMPGERAAHRDERLSQPRAEGWLLVEWRQDEDEPTKYWSANLPDDISFERLVDLAKLRWRIERDYQELKQELGLGHYEGRGWRGFHHHATLCIAAYGFLISEREMPPPSGSRTTPHFQRPAIPLSYRPRGAADPARAAYTELDRDNASTPHHRSRRK
jgi:SRSO17 transposase